ncbi:hypothetical protein [Lacisediminihabitans changchengi]|nr:hypothetical protein [Lacisediminihabitans changchengi]
MKANKQLSDNLQAVLVDLLEQYAWMVSAENMKPRKRGATSGT